MTNVQAIKGLQFVGLEMTKAIAETNDENEITCIKHNIEIIEKSIDALEKQIPKRTKRESFRVGNTNHFGNLCPTCKHPFGAMILHCANCGQAIDWSEK